MPYGRSCICEKELPIDYGSRIALKKHASLSLSFQCLVEKVQKLEELCSKKEKFLQVCVWRSYVSSEIDIIWNNRKYRAYFVHITLNFFFVLQSTKMILKFRESTISRLERLRKRDKEGPDGQDDDKEREIVSSAETFLDFLYLSMFCLQNG